MEATKVWITSSPQHSSAKPCMNSDVTLGQLPRQHTCLERLGKSPEQHI